MGDVIILCNNSRDDQAVCWAYFTVPYSTKPSAKLSSCFRLTLSNCSTVDEVQWYACCVIKFMMLSYLLGIMGKA